MPLGWYLGQGLIPLGDSSSDDEDGPCELPDGRVVCGLHGLTICTRCCVDYSFIEPRAGAGHDGDSEGGEDSDDGDGCDWEDEGEDYAADQNPADDIDHGLKRGTGRCFPAKFVPPSDSVTPSALFSATRAHMMVRRYVHPDDAGMAIIRTDGACLNNGQRDAKAAWAFWHGIGPGDKPLVVEGRLEKEGPYGDAGRQTSNRAELRAVIAVLEFRYWPGEGFHTLVIATDSEYVVQGGTTWARSWIQRGWKTNRGTDVENRDLWEALLGQVETYNAQGMTVQFWRIPRGWNTVADAAAKSAAAEEHTPETWTQCIGLNVSIGTST